MNKFIKITFLGASRVAQWSRALHRNASCATSYWVTGPPVTGFAPRLCCSRPCPGGLWEVNWTSVVRVREGLASRDILVLSRTSDSCGGPGAVHANQGRQVHGVSSGWLPGWMCAVLRSSVAWLGCVSFVSPEPV